MLKGARSYFSKFSSLFYLKNHHSKDVNFKFQLKRSSRLDIRSNFFILQLPISYCVSLIMVTITRQVFTNIFQMEHFSAVKFAMDYEKNMSSLVIPKISKSLKKKVEKIGLGSFNMTAANSYSTFSLFMAHQYCILYHDRGVSNCRNGLYSVSNVFSHGTLAHLIVYIKLVMAYADS